MLSHTFIIIIIFVKYATVIILYCMIIWSKTLLELTNLHIYIYIIVFNSLTKWEEKRGYIFPSVWRWKIHAQREDFFIFQSYFISHSVDKGFFMFHKKEKKKSNSILNDAKGHRLAHPTWLHSSWWGHAAIESTVAERSKDQERWEIKVGKANGRKIRFKSNCYNFLDLI